MSVTKIQLSRTSMVVIEAMQKAVAFVCERGDVRIYDMMLEIDSETKPDRKVYVSARIGLKHAAIPIYVELPLARDDSQNCSIDRSRKIQFVTHGVFAWFIEKEGNRREPEKGTEANLARVRDKIIKNL